MIPQYPPNKSSNNNNNGGAQQRHTLGAPTTATMTRTMPSSYAFPMSMMLHHTCGSNQQQQQQQQQQHLQRALPHHPPSWTLPHLASMESLNTNNATATMVMAQNQQQQQNQQQLAAFSSSSLLSEDVLDGGHEYILVDGDLIEILAQDATTIQAAALATAATTTAMTQNPTQTCNAVCTSCPSFIKCLHCNISKGEAMTTSFSLATGSATLAGQYYQPGWWQQL